MTTARVPAKVRPYITCLSIVLLLQSSISLAISSVSCIQLSPPQFAAQELANSLRGNVVKVQRVKKGSKEISATGFGFIVGERNRRLYIVTADHVARSGSENTKLGLKEDLQVRFYLRNSQWQQATLLEKHSPRPQDLAVMEVPAPEGLNWKRNCSADINKLIAMSPNRTLRGLTALFIGRQTNSDDLWFVPSNSGSIHGNPNTQSLISVEITTVMGGTSGAPLVTEAGILGMIVQDEGGGVAKALSIDFIQKAFDEWQYEWSLTPLAPGPIPIIAQAIAQLIPMPSKRDRMIMIIGGIGFGSSGAEVWVNDVNVSNQISRQDNGIIQLEGDQKTLNLIKGKNKVIVVVGSVKSEPYTFTDKFQGIR